MYQSHIQVKKQNKTNDEKSYFSHKTQEDVQIISFYVCVKMYTCTYVRLGPRKVLDAPELEL